MARNRMIKPDFWDDEKLSKLSRDARLTFIGLWSHADDVGISKGNTKWLNNNIFPYDEIKPDTFEKWIDELIRMRLIMPYEVSGEKFIHIRNFLKHQTINKPTPSKNPQPEDLLLRDYYGSSVVEFQPKISKDKIKEVKISEEEFDRFWKISKDKIKEVKVSEEEFDRFWNLYAKKVGREKALDKFGKLKEEERLKIFETLPAYIEATPDLKFRKDPSTYLNNKSWNDEIISNSPKKPKQVSLETYRDAFGELA